MIQHVRHLLRSRSRQELWLLLAVLVVVVGTWVFIVLADEVTEGATRSFDDWAIQALRRPDNPAIPIGPRWLTDVMRDITALGGFAVLTIVIVVVSGFLLLRRKYHAMGLVLIAVIGGELLSTALKHLIGRPRPPAIGRLVDVHNPSFPSGHSMLSAVVYLTLGALLARLITDWPSRIYFLVVALLLTFLVGISRIYLGAHYPTDVLAGWTAGLVWAMLCWTVVEYLQRRGKVEQTLESPSDSSPHPLN
ncbi:MAG: phosphatase PAP2 family protein [Bacillota bacterium]